MIELFKIQLPIVSSDPNPQAYIYNKERNIKLLVPIMEVIGFFNEGELKIFVLAEVTKTGIDIIKKVQYQEW